MSIDFQRSPETANGGFLPELTFRNLSFVQNNSYEDTARLARYALFWDFYNGRHYKKTRPDGEPQITANFCRLFVDKSANFLMGKGWNIKNRDEFYSKDLHDFVNETWTLNNKTLTTFEMAQLGGMLGDVFALVLPDNAGGVSISIVPPMLCFPVFHPANKQQILAAKIQYPLNMDGTKNGPQMLTIVMDSTWIHQFIDDRRVYSAAHNLGEVPLVMIRNRPIAGAGFGASDIAEITNLNELYNKKLTDISDIINYYASPVTVAYGIKIKQLQRGVRKFWSIPTSYKDAKIENLELKGDLAAANGHLKHLQELMHHLTGVPEIALGKEMNFSNTSGLAIQLLFQPLIDVTTIKTLTYGQGIMQINRLIAKYGIQYGYVQPPALSTWRELELFYRTDIEFVNPLPMDAMLNLNMIMNRIEKGLITIDDALSQLGITDIEAYKKQILKDVEEGNNIPLFLQIASRIQTDSSKLMNLGGIMGNRQNPDAIIRQNSREIAKVSMAS